MNCSPRTMVPLPGDVFLASPSISTVIIVVM